ncbi:MAG: hypothetical protein OWT27_03400, partial [Firmicutes bacterium]|nr:hypothetical protein [Bacillota bacterium]
MKRVLWIRNWADRGLTWLLVGLVVLSGILSVLIWTGTSPPTVVNDRTAFFAVSKFGGTRAAAAVLRPHAVWLWTDRDELFRADGDGPFAMRVEQALRRATWTRLRAPRKLAGGSYIELDYGAVRLSRGLLRLLLGHVQGSEPTATGSLYIRAVAGRLLLTYRSGKSVIALRVNRGSRALSKLFLPTDDTIPMEQVPTASGIASLPYAPIRLPVITWSLAEVSKRVAAAYFADPTAAHPMKMSESGDEILTDGTRGVMIRAGYAQPLLIYVAPVGRLAGYVNSERRALATAVGFINNHGAFTGSNIRLAAATEPSRSRNDFVFAVWVQGWPLFGSLDRIQVDLRDGIVNDLRRGLVYPAFTIATQAETVLSAQQLLSIIGKAGMAKLARIQLGYLAISQGAGLAVGEPVFQLT